MDVNHHECTAGAHDFDYVAADYGSDAELQAHSGNVRLCNDCGAVCFYCTNDENYHHGGLSTPSCFLVPEEGTGQCVYARVPLDREPGEPAQRVCLTHMDVLAMNVLGAGQPCQGRR